VAFAFSPPLPPPLPAELAGAPRLDIYI
jgi:hypothetical protein